MGDVHVHWVRMYPVPDSAEGQAHEKGSLAGRGPHGDKGVEAGESEPRDEALDHSDGHQTPGVDPALAEGTQHQFLLR